MVHIHFSRWTPELTPSFYLGVGLSCVARCAPVTAAHADSPRWAQRSVKLGHFWELELGKGAWKIAGMEIQIRVFLCFFQGYDMLWYLPIEKIHYKYLWPWVGSNVDDPLGVVAIVSLSIRNDVRKNRAWSYLQPKWNLLWMVISRFVGQTSKSGAFQFQI